MGYRYRNDSDVAGAFDDTRCRNRNRNGDVAGAFDNNRRVRFTGYINEEDLCRAVRRCLLNDLVAGAEDDRDDDRHCCKRRR